MTTDSFTLVPLSRSAVDARYLREVPATIEREGISAAETGIASVIDCARAVGISPVLVSVLADPTAPEVVRSRAFGMIALRLAVAGSSGDPASCVPPDGARAVAALTA